MAAVGPCDVDVGVADGVGDRGVGGGAVARPDRLADLLTGAAGERPHLARGCVGDHDLAARPVEDLRAVRRPARRELHVQVERAGVPAAKVVQEMAVEVGDDDLAQPVEHESLSIR